jgi:hypothetical protein
MTRYPYTGINGVYYATEIIEAAVAELHKKAPMWMAEIDEPTPCEMIAYDMLKQIGAL